MKNSYALCIVLKINNPEEMSEKDNWILHCAHPNNTPSVCSIESTGYKFADRFVVDGWPRNVYYRSTSIQR